MCVLNILQYYNWHDKRVRSLRLLNIKDSILANQIYEGTCIITPMKKYISFCMKNQLKVILAHTQLFEKFLSLLWLLLQHIDPQHPPNLAELGDSWSPYIFVHTKSMHCTLYCAFKSCCHGVVGLQLLSQIPAADTLSVTNLCSDNLMTISKLLD